MRVLVDTQIFLWAITDDARLTTALRSHYRDPEHGLYLSIASIWEMLIKVGLGKLPLPQPSTPYILRQMERNGLELLPVRTSHLAALEKLPALHRDPFDRLLVAQAKAESMPMLTSDPEMRGYGVEVL